MYEQVYERAFSYTEALMDQLHFDIKTDLKQGISFYQNASPEERERDFHIFLKEYKKLVQLEKKQGEEGKQVILLCTYFILRIADSPRLLDYYPFEPDKNYDKEAVRQVCIKSGLLPNEERVDSVYREISRSRFLSASRYVFASLLMNVCSASRIPEFVSVQRAHQFTILVNFSTAGQMTPSELSFPTFERLPVMQFLRNPPTVPHPCSQAQWNEVKAEVMENFYQAFSSLSNYDQYMATGIYIDKQKNSMPHFLGCYLISICSTSYDEKITDSLYTLKEKSKPEIFPRDQYTNDILGDNWCEVQSFQKLKQGLPLTDKETDSMKHYFTSTGGGTVRDYYLFSRTEFYIELYIRLKLDQLKEKNQEIEKANLALEQEKARTGRILAEMSHEKTHITNSVNADRLEQVWQAIPNLEEKELIFDLDKEKRGYLLRDFSLLDKQYSKEPSDWVEIFQEQLDLDPENGNFLTMLDDALYHLLHHFQQDHSWMKNPQLQEMLMPLNSCAFLNPLKENRYDYVKDWFGDAYYPVDVAIEGTWSDAYFSRYSYENDQESISLAYIQWVEIFTIVWEYLFTKGAKNSENQLKIRFFQEEHRYGISFEQKNIENQHHLPWQELGLCYLRDFLEDLNEGEALKEEGDKLTLYLPLTILQKKQGDKKHEIFIDR